MGFVLKTPLASVRRADPAIAPMIQLADLIQFRQNDPKGISTKLFRPKAFMENGYAIPKVLLC